MSLLNPRPLKCCRRRPTTTSVCCLVLLGSLSLPTFIIQAQTLPGWTLVWQDEFTQANGTPPSSSRWNYNIGTGNNGWGNAELQYYTSRTNNARIENNQLVIEAHQESYAGSDYTSARLLTQNKWTWTYGRMEARIKVPYGQGIWPAFWMLGADINDPGVGWPNCGEIDIMEHIGREPQTVYGTIHGPGYSAGDSFGGEMNIGTNVTDDFHVFAVEWETNRIEWYVDDFLYHVATPTSVAPNPWVFDHPHFFILNVAVGGQWPGYPDDTTVFPQQMLVDYVRVYTRTNSPSPQPPPAGTNALINPGFESSVSAPWVGYASGGANKRGAYVESTNNTYYNGGNPGGDNVLTHSGTYVGKLYGDFSGSENDNGCYQDIPATPGSLWNADGWALSHQQDLMQGVNTSWIEVSFRNDFDTILALYKSEVLDSGTISVSSWMHLPVTNQLDTATSVVTNTTSTLTAPAGTTKARYQIVYRQPAYDGGSMYYDDLNLVLQPVAASVTLSAVLVGGDIQIRFPTQNGVSYEVAYKSSLTDPSWTPIETVPGDGSTKTVSYSANVPSRFYTVLTP